MVELVDTPDLESGAVRCVGSSPTPGTTLGLRISLLVKEGPIAWDPITIGDQAIGPSFIQNRLRLEALKPKVESLAYDFFFVPMSFVFIGKKKSRPLPLTLNFHKT